MITIVGGTYREICLEPNHNEIFGSGLRAVRLLLENTNENINFYTCGEDTVENELFNYKNVFDRLWYSRKESKSIVTFKYNFFLDNPLVCNIDIHDNNSDCIDIDVDAGNIICFGLLEADLNVMNASKIVFDPQSANNKSFNIQGKTHRLIYILNEIEAKTISGSTKIEDVLDYFFDEKQVYALVVKKGPKGACLYQNKKEIYSVSAYKTDNVFKIGSGDIFTTTFSYFWFSNPKMKLEECLEKASVVTALYCDKGFYSALFASVASNKFPPLVLSSTLNEKLIYIAAPIFTLPDLILVDKIRDCFISFGIDIFSPFHDVGIGDNDDIVLLDLNAINKSNIIFAVVDGLDAGTMVELGYAIANNKKIICYNKLENKSSLLMLKNKNVFFFNDLTTAIYQTIWCL